MKLLILGGTVFVGRHLAEAATAAGHQVTLFNRGKSNAKPFHNVEQIHGDRDKDLHLLDNHSWDAVIDTCGYVPRAARASVQALKDKVNHYTFISSVSVYADTSRPGIDETAPVATLSNPMIEEVTGDTYGPLKALCEKAIEESMPGKTLIIRPGLIVGPHDSTDRFTYWVHRFNKGGDILVPDIFGRQIQIIDVRDLAEWTISLIERKVTGIFNATGPAYKLTFGKFIETCQSVCNGAATFKKVPEKVLLEAGCEPWSDLPLWLPDELKYRGFLSVDCSRAIAAGLKFRPLADTIKDTLDWHKGRSSHKLKAGLSVQKEQQILRAAAAKKTT